MAKKDKKSTVEIRNKKAGFEYEFLESFTAGIVLNGTEIKSIRAGKASLVDSWCYFVNGELYVKNMNVAEYWWGSAFSRQDPKRDRKLLLTKKELRKLARAVKEKGLTIVATRLFIAENGYAKLNIALARGKREFDKRETIKEKASGWRGMHTDEITMSIGYATAKKNPGASVDELEHAADADMYAEKEKYYKEHGIDRRRH